MKKLKLKIVEKNGYNEVDFEIIEYTKKEVIDLVNLAISKFYDKPTICRPCIYYDNCYADYKDKEHCVIIKEETECPIKADS